MITIVIRQERKSSPVRYFGTGRHHDDVANGGQAAQVQRLPAPCNVVIFYQENEKKNISDVELSTVNPPRTR